MLLLYFQQLYSVGLFSLSIKWFMTFAHHTVNQPRSTTRWCWIKINKTFCIPSSNLKELSFTTFFSWSSKNSKKAKKSENKFWWRFITTKNWINLLYYIIDVAHEIAPGDIWLNFSPNLSDRSDDALVSSVIENITFLAHINDVMTRKNIFVTMIACQLFSVFSAKYHDFFFRHPSILISRLFSQ